MAPPRPSRLRLLVFMLVASAFCTFYQTAHAAKINCWQIRRTNDAGAPYDVLVYPTGMRITYKDFIMVTKPPFTHCVTYHTSNKTYLEVTMEKGSQLFRGRSQHGKAVEKYTFKVKPRGHAIIAGLPSDEFHIDGYNEEGKLRMSKRIWTTKSIAVPQKELDSYAKLVRLPDGLKFPMRMIKEEINAKRKVDIVEMDTSSIKHVKLDAKALEPPQGFRKVKNEIELLIDPGDQETMDMFSQPSD